MIRVTIELLPHGCEERRRHLGTVLIANDGSNGAGPVGDYAAVLSRRGQPGSVWKCAPVSGFPRKRLGAYDLLYRVLRVAVGNRNP